MPAVRILLVAALVQPAALVCSADDSAPQRPNIILCMADDLGWGDTGYNGNSELKTPHLDQMASEGVRFNRFYSAAPVCSPTRGSCLTGRHPYRLGIPFANAGHMQPEELTIAELLQKLGYRTGHFGKWHLGTLTKTIRDGRRGGTKKGIDHFSPPWDNGFDKCFSTEAQMPTWNPMQNQAVAGKFWLGPESFETENVSGDAARVVMDRAIAMIEASHAADDPFFVVIWFHAPHSPVVAGPEHRALYADLSENKQHYYGCITALDEQIGRLRKRLAELSISDNTMLWFCSDNGPAAKGGGPGKAAGGRQQGITGGLRGRKGSLYEGGIRVPGLLVWPNGIAHAKTIDAPCVTSDYLPTIVDVLGIPQQQLSNHELDGISLKPILDGTRQLRGKPIGFQSRKQLAWSDDQYKLYSSDGGKSFELYDLLVDPNESKNIADQFPDLVKRMSDELTQWVASCQNSEVTANQ
ncbi:MAG: sulfatase-like hydrolase/transferase [Planctomycetales bacterium]|nr:sulfatase-like hydrolase/transferase [Planctomycetales bacterium]